MSQEQKPEAQETPAPSPDELVQDLQPRLTDKDADTVKGGNAATTGQKAAEKSDQYIRS